MAPVPSPSDRERERVGPHPSYIEVAKPYILQSRIQKCLTDVSMSDAKEDMVRLQGVAWIDQVRRALQLPIRTFNTAVIYYHKFRLLHSDSEYNWADASAAALFTACKIEDTLKKSREILCANWNMKVGPGETLSSDDPRFENHSKLIIGLERLMLESAGFDFRNRYPQKLMVKLARALGFDKHNVSKTAWNLSIDLYRTLAPLKQTTPTLAIACVELAARLHDMDATRLVDAGIMKYSKWATSRAEVMETLLDLLDLYTHHRSLTAVGPLYTLEAFIDVRIGLNQEASAAKIARYALYASDTASEFQQSTNGLKPRNGIDPTSPLTPATPGTISPGNTQPPASAIGVRGQNGTVRFMLDAARARDERIEVDKFHKVEEEEYEVEVPIDTRLDDRDRRSRDFEADQLFERSELPEEIPAKDLPRQTFGGSSYWEKFRQRAAMKSTDFTIDDSCFVEDRIDYFGDHDTRATMRPTYPKIDDPSLVEDRIDYFGDLDVQLAHAEYAKQKDVSEDSPHRISLDDCNSDDFRQDSRSATLSKKTQHSKRPSRASRGGQGSSRDESRYDHYSRKRSRSPRRHHNDTLRYRCSSPGRFRDDRDEHDVGRDDIRRGRGNGRGRGRGRGRGGGARGRRETNARDQSRDSNARRYSVSSYGEQAGFTNDRDQHGSLRNDIDSYRSHRSHKPRHDDMADQPTSYARARQDSLSIPIDDFVGKNDDNCPTSQPVAGGIHPDRMRLMSPFNEDAHGLNLKAFPSRSEMGKIASKRINKQPKPARMLISLKDRGPASPQRAASPRPAPPRDQGLSAEDGHQWVRDDNRKGGGRGDNRGRGRGRGGRNQRGGPQRRADDDRGYERYTRSPAFPRPKKRGQKWAPDD